MKMIYRLALLMMVLTAGLHFTIPTYAAESKTQALAGSCINSNISESDGVQTGAVSGRMSSKDYFGVIKRAKAAHLTLGSDGFLWSTKPLICDSAAIVQMDDYKGHTMVTFSNGDPNKPVIGFAGGVVAGDGPLFFSETIYLADGKAMPLNQNGGSQGCHFNFTDSGTFTEGWERRLTAIVCDLRVKTDTGHLISADVIFKVTQTPTRHPSRDPASDRPQ